MGLAIQVQGTRAQAPVTQILARAIARTTKTPRTARTIRTIVKVVALNRFGGRDRRFARSRF